MLFSCLQAKERILKQCQPPSVVYLLCIRQISGSNLDITTEDFHAFLMPSGQRTDTKTIHHLSLPPNLHFFTSHPNHAAIISIDNTAVFRVIVPFKE